MAKVAFLGLGVMGYPMAGHLAAAGHEVTVYNRTAAKAEAWVAQHGGSMGATPAEAAKGAEFVMACVGNDDDLRSVCLGADGALGAMEAGTVFVDHTTVSAAVTAELETRAREAGISFVDAPVSGGIMGAINGTLTFMAGGSEEALDAADAILEPMAGRVVRCGEGGAGQAAKVCNNMILAVTMIGTCEAFELGRRLGLTDQALFDVVSTASGQSWSTTTYCPVPGPVPTSPANNEYKPGFAVDLMLKDLNLAQQASNEVGAETPLGQTARELYAEFSQDGNGGVDFSGIIKKFQKKL